MLKSGQHDDSFYRELGEIILGFGENALAQLSEGDPKREDILEIVKAGRRSADLTKQLLAFSRKQTLRRICPAIPTTT